jgi:hypothetical protein
VSLDWSEVVLPVLEELSLGRSLERKTRVDEGMSSGGNSCVRKRVSPGVRKGVQM